MRVLCLDVGTARIGIAVSDPLGISAQPVETLATRGQSRDVDHILALLAELGADRVVLGLPLSLNGQENEATARSRALADALLELQPGLMVEFQDERFTTAIAESVLIEGGMGRKKRKAVIDQAAAVLILQGWLDGQV